MLCIMHNRQGVGLCGSVRLCVALYGSQGSGWGLCMVWGVSWLRTALDGSQRVLQGCVRMRMRVRSCVCVYACACGVARGSVSGVLSVGRVCGSVCLWSALWVCVGSVCVGSGAECRAWGRGLWGLVQGRNGSTVVMVK